MPPELDEAKVTRLATIAAWLDGCREDLEDCQGLLATFNHEANVAYELSYFQGIYGAMDHTTFVREVLSQPAITTIADITYDELLELVTRVCGAEGAEHEQSFWLHLLQANLPDLEDQTRVLSPKEILDIALAYKPILLPP